MLQFWCQLKAVADCSPGNWRKTAKDMPPHCFGPCGRVKIKGLVVFSEMWVGVGVFGGICCLHLRGVINIFASCFLATVAFVFHYSQYHIPDDRGLPTSPSPHVTSLKLTISYNVVSHLSHILGEEWVELYLCYPYTHSCLRCGRLYLFNSTTCMWGRDSSVGIATRYGLDGPGIESRWERDFPHPSRPALWPTQPPVQWVPGLYWG